MDHPVPQDGTGCVIGIDPGARYTGVAVVNANEELLASWVFVRPDSTDKFDDFHAWANKLVSIIEDKVIPLFPGATLGIEAVSNPKGFHKGQRAMMDPKDIMWTSFIVGFLSCNYKDAVLVRPGNNGGQNLDFYPDGLVGRRPKNLIGINENGAPRKHERSAYDVAVKALT